MYYIGIDLGGTNIAAGIVREDGKIVVQSSVPTLSQRPTDEIVKDMVFLSKQLIKDAELELNDIEAVGIGCPGTINFETGEVIYSNNIKMEHYMLAKEFQKYLNLPVKIDNDANCAAMGEYIVSGNNVPIFMFITLGTGVGSGLILNGKVFRGFNGAASEAGHITLVSGGEPCTCGKRGCWETYASVTALIRQTKVAMEKNPESLMHEIAKAEGKISGRTSFDAAKQGDKAAQAVVKQYAQYVADGIVSVENVLQPDIISVGGGISREGEYLIKPIFEYSAANCCNKFMPKTKIVTAQSFNDAGIIGAAMIAK